MTENDRHTGEAARLIAEMFDGCPAFMLVVAADGSVLYSNAKAACILEQNTVAQVMTGYDTAAITTGGNAEYVLTLNNRYYKVSAVRITWLGDRAAHLLLGVDISEAMAQNAAADAMTGIHSRQSGLDMLAQYICKAQKGDYTFTVCYFDINDMQYTNNTFGQDEGDAYIHAVVNVIKHQIRQTDFFAHMDGDAFLLIFPKCHYQIVADIMDTVMNRFNVINEMSENKPLPYSISYGVLEVNSEALLDSEHILKTVISAMEDMRDAYRARRTLPPTP